MSHAPTANSQFRLLLLMILAATACGKSPPKQAGDGDSAAFVQALERGDTGQAAGPAVPEDLVPVALASAENYCRREHYDLNGPFRLICKDYEVYTKRNSNGVYETAHLELTSADRANGVEDKWCVAISFLSRRDARPAWQDDSYRTTYTKHSGAWQIEHVNADPSYFGCAS